MGTYSRFKIKVKLLKNTPVEVLRVLAEHDYREDVCAQKIKLMKEPLVIPSHEFFTLPRWESCLSMLNWDDIIGLNLDWNGFVWILRIESDFKNYDCEIEAFVKWISPYVAGRKKKQYIGSHKGEWATRETNIYIHRSPNGRVRVEIW